MRFLPISVVLKKVTLFRGVPCKHVVKSTVLVFHFPFPAFAAKEARNLSICCIITQHLKYKDLNVENGCITKLENISMSLEHSVVCLYVSGAFSGSIYSQSK